MGEIFYLNKRKGLLNFKRKLIKLKSNAIFLANGFAYRMADISQQKANGSGQVKMAQQLPNPNQGQLAGNRPHSVPPKSQNLIGWEKTFFFQENKQFRKIL